MTGILTSPHGGIVLHATTTLVEHEGVETQIVRDVIANNLLHSADQIGQVRVNWTSEAGAYYTAGSAPIDTNAEWVRVCVLGYFPLTIRHDNLSYYVRVRVGVASSDASTINARLVMQAWNYQQEDANNGAVFASPLNNVTDIQFASATAGWENGGVIFLSSRQVDAATTRMSVANDTISVASYSTNVVKVYATLWAAPADVPQIRVHGCYMAEVLDSDPAAEIA